MDITTPIAKQIFDIPVLYGYKMYVMHVDGYLVCILLEPIHMCNVQVLTDALMMCVCVSHEDVWYM